MSPSKKPPVSRTEVATAMRELRENGNTVSIRSVRQRVGRGSLTTISRHVEAVNAGNESPEIHLEQFPNRLESLCREMAEMMDEMAMERVAHERALVEQEAQNLVKQKNSLVHERELAVTAYEAEQRVSADLRARLAETLNLLALAEAELDEVRPKLAKADMLNEQLSERVMEGSRRVDRLQLQITTYEDEVKKQRQIDADKHAGQVSALEQSLSNSRGNELRLTEQLGEANRKIDRLNAGLDSAESRATASEAEHLKLQQLVGELSVEQTNSRKREAEREQRLLSAVSDKEAAAGKISSLQDQLIEAQSNIERLRQNGVAESRSLIINLVEHSRRVFELARKHSPKGDADVSEAATSQKELERLFCSAN